VILMLEKTGLAWDVVRVGAARQAAKALPLEPADHSVAS
jgi:hypothetical protein